MRHKYVVSHHQRFSTCYDEKVDTETVYEDGVKHLLLHAMQGGKAVCMMYGQTGSGKTYTMSGLFQFLSDDLFTEAVGDVDFAVSVSAVEIAGTKCYGALLAVGTLLFTYRSHPRPREGSRVRRWRRQHQLGWHDRSGGGLDELVAGGA